MALEQPVVVLVAIVGGIVLAERQPACRTLFRWCPIPLWCYVLPLIAVTMGWLPHGHPIYPALTTQLLPFTLGLMLLGVDLPAVLRTGGSALLAAVIGAAGIMIGAPLGVWLLQSHLPHAAWKGAGALAATWTGGTMNLLAVRSILQPPEEVFAPLILVDPAIAYSWMALLVSASGHQETINRWLRASTPHEPHTQHSDEQEQPLSTPFALAICCVCSVIMTLGAHLLATHLPTSRYVSTSSGWAILLVTTSALALSLIPFIRRVGAHGGLLGYPCLYLVLAATGAQADAGALWSAPWWLVLGVGVALFHGTMLLLAGRALRIPLGTLATASQANIGGVVSAPMVGAVYHQSLVPIGLVLAVAYNALGTYFGLLSASWCRWLTHQ